MLRRAVVLITLLGAIASGGCAGDSRKSAADSCTKYRDHMIDLRLGQTPTPEMSDEKRDRELAKHHAVLVKAAGQSLVDECKSKSREQIACALAAEDMAGAHKCIGLVPTKTASKQTGGNR